MLAAPRPSTKAQTLPAPTGGMDTLTNLITMDPRYSILTKNLDATTRGLSVRPGYIQWATTFAAGGAISTIIPFLGSEEDGSEDQLFAANTDGIYNITSSGAGPTKDLSWGTTTATAGRCAFTQFTTEASDHFLLVADDVNGYQAYQEGVGWSVPTVTPVSGSLTAGEIAFVTVWGARVWVIARNGTDGWYSDAGAYQGNFTPFNFGALMRYGGNLRAIYNWTLDSGEGPEDLLVAVGGGGDVLVYGGTDPAAATTFGIVGRWFIGDMPQGRRFGSQFGGDLLLLSTTGLISMTALTRGVDPFSLEASASWRIQGFLDELMAASRDEFGWEIKAHPSLNKIIVSTPKVNGQQYVQLVYDTNMKAWGTWSKVPAGTSATWRDDVYIAGEGESVWQMGGSVDNVTLVSPDPAPIEFEMISAFSSMGEPERVKRMQFLRPVFLANQQPAFTVEAKYDYDLSSVALPSSSNELGAGVWQPSGAGDGVWDNSLWGGIKSTFSPPQGAQGIGAAMAVGIRGKSTTPTTLISIGVFWDSGGLF